MDNYEKITKNRPHVVILGAGASKAALPEGDKYHKPISCMENFFQNLKMDDLINNLNLETKSSNLEKIFSEIEEKSKTNIEFLNAKKQIENTIFDYFNSYSIPDEPTIYDFLLFY